MTNIPGVFTVSRNKQIKQKSWKLHLILKLLGLLRISLEQSVFSLQCNSLPSWLWDLSHWVYSSFTSQCSCQKMFTYLLSFLLSIFPHAFISWFACSICVVAVLFIFMLCMRGQLSSDFPLALTQRWWAHDHFASHHSPGDFSSAQGRYSSVTFIWFFSASDKEEELRWATFC